VRGLGSLKLGESRRRRRREERKWKCIDEKEQDR